MTDPGAHILRGEAVEKASNEGPLDQNLGISVDEGMNALLYLDGVRNEQVDVLKSALNSLQSYSATSVDKEALASIDIVE